MSPRGDSLLGQGEGLAAEAEFVKAKTTILAAINLQPTDAAKALIELGMLYGNQAKNPVRASRKMLTASRVFRSDFSK